MTRQMVQKSERTYVRYDARPVTVPAYRGSVTVVTSVAPGTDSVETIYCLCGTSDRPKGHSTMGAAERCARRMVADLTRIYGPTFTADDANRHANGLRRLGHDV